MSANGEEIGMRLERGNAAMERKRNCERQLTLSA